MKRYISEFIQKDLSSKFVILSGPRQSGKTTLSKNLSLTSEYINYDLKEHRKILLEKSWDRKNKIIIFDEIHKMKNWKSFLKGIYDTEGINPGILVTGSARLDTYRKSGDSLAGRYFAYRLHPLDIKELYKFSNEKDENKILEKLLTVGGFPEPYLNGKIEYYRRWKKTHQDIIIRQDLLDLEKVRDISSIETLIELMRERVGSSISYTSLSEDLQYSSKTIKHWLQILENLYVIFKIKPYHKNIARALLKEPKYYFFDTGQVSGDEGVKLENVVACAILKELHYMEDVKGTSTNLYYLRSKEKKEIDFLIEIDKKITTLIEVKLSETNLSPNFRAFSRYFPQAKKIQLVKNLDREKTFPDGCEIRYVAKWLKTMKFF
ncbi:MAG: ATP-binding protein [Leptospiraceae bacterium]|nr:ATP-binding protein [Leptospiraceae bacterium]MCK6380192.1 ATP-binding protein [Leptospiraceae bacterium]NUM42588.1 ATP-binding protein [Leptospiraceae bacterium]